MFMNRRFELRPTRQLATIPSEMYAVEVGAELLERLVNDKSALYMTDPEEEKKWKDISTEDLDIIADAVGLCEKYWKES